MDRFSFYKKLKGKDLRRFEALLNGLLSEIYLIENNENVALEHKAALLAAANEFLEFFKKRGA